MSSQTVPFAGVRVLELSGTPAAAFVGKLFARWGAEVLALRDSDRSLVDDGACVSEPALHEFLDGGKRLLELSSTADERADLIRRLAADCDIVVSDEPPDRFEWSRGLIAAVAPGPRVLTSITPFGLDGPCRDWQATQATLLAHGGYSHLIGAPDGPPLTFVGLYADYQAALYAYVATVSAYLASKPETTLVEVSVLESLASLHQHTFAQLNYAGVVRRRHGNRWPHLQYTCIVPCKDGWVSPNVLPAFWDSFTLFLGRPELREDPRFDQPVRRIENIDALDEVVLPIFAQRTKQEIMTEAQEQFRIPVGMVTTLDDVLADPHLEQRRFWCKVATQGKRIRKTTSPFRFGEEPPPLEQAATAPIQDASLVVWRTPRVGQVFTPKRRPAWPVQAAAGPLNGVRVLDLTRVWAGPLATRILADLGAEVIKVESPDGRGPASPAWRHPAWLRPPGPRPWNEQGSLNKLARNKLGLAVNLKAPAGRELLLRLVEQSDVVIENFSLRAMSGLGLSYETLREANRGIVYVAMPGFGRYGPYSSYVSYGPVLEAMSGVPALLGYGDGTPRFTSKAIPDAIAGTHAAAAVLTALQRRAITGQGFAVDLSQHEAAIEFLGEYFIDYQLTGEPPRVLGNRHPRWAPHGIYPAAGDDSYVAIAVRDESEWKSLSDQAGVGWADDPRFETVAARREHAEALDQAIANWTCRSPASDRAQQLQAAGVPAAAVLTAPEMLADAHLRARDFFVTLDQPDVGPCDYPGSPLRLNRQRHLGWKPAPTLGEDNRLLLQALLGMEDDAIAILADQGVIVDRPPA